MAERPHSNDKWWPLFIITANKKLIPKSLCYVAQRKFFTFLFKLRFEKLQRERRKRSKPWLGGCIWWLPSFTSLTAVQVTYRHMYDNYIRRLWRQPSCIKSHHQPQRPEHYQHQSHCCSSSNTQRSATSTVRQQPLQPQPYERKF